MKEKVFHANGNQNKTDIVILDKINFKSKLQQEAQSLYSNNNKKTSSGHNLCKHLFI